MLTLGVPDTAVDAIMCWEPGQSARMRRRHQEPGAAPHLAGYIAGQLGNAK